MLFCFTMPLCLENILWGNWACTRKLFAYRLLQKMFFLVFSSQFYRERATLGEIIKGPQSMTCILQELSQFLYRHNFLTSHSRLTVLLWNFSLRQNSKVYSFSIRPQMNRNLYSFFVETLTTRNLLNFPLNQNYAKRTSRKTGLN